MVLTVLKYLFVTLTFFFPQVINKSDYMSLCVMILLNLHMSFRLEFQKNDPSETADIRNGDNEECGNWVRLSCVVHWIINFAST